MSNTLNIGVLTFHRCINYGSYWQARCLVEGLRRQGLAAVLLDHRSTRIERKEWRCALAPVPGVAKDAAAYSGKARLFLEAFDDLPTSAPFDVDRPEDAPTFDLIVVGSDEVWNLRHPWYGGQPVFYGDGLSGRLVSYAASFGNHDADWGLEPCWSDRLRGFSAISVRDANSHRMIRASLGLEPATVLDPCLQFPEAIVRTENRFAAPYVAVYGHSFPDWYAAAMRAWSDRHGVPLISIGYRNDWADEQLIEARPLEFAAFVSGAEAVLTNFFHGCVFSLLYDKPFACVGSDYRQNKVRDLLQLMDVSERLLTPEADVTRVDGLLERPPGSAAQERIELLRSRSTGYLDHVLH